MSEFFITDAEVAKVEPFLTSIDCLLKPEKHRSTKGSIVWHGPSGSEVETLLTLSGLDMWSFGVLVGASLSTVNRWKLSSGVSNIHYLAFRELVTHYLSTI